MTLRAAGSARVFMRLLAASAWGSWREIATVPATFGTAYQVPRVNAGATALEYGDGGRVLLASKTASASATLDFTEFNNAVFRGYEFILENVKPATDAVTLAIRLSTDAGATYDAGASDYSYAMVHLGVGGSITPASSSADTRIEVTSSGSVGNLSTERGVSGEITIYTPGSTAEQSRVKFDTQWDNAASGVLITCRGNGVRRADQDTTAARFLFTTGNIASGTIRLYGLT